MAYFSYHIIHLLYFVKLSSQLQIDKEESLERRVITDIVENLTRINNALENLILRYNNFRVRKDPGKVVFDGNKLQMNYASIIKKKKQRDKKTGFIKSKKKTVNALMSPSEEMANKMLNNIAALQLNSDSRLPTTRLPIKLRPAKSKKQKEKSKTVVIQILSQEYGKRDEMKFSSEKKIHLNNLESTEIMDSESDSAWRMHHHHLPSVSRENEIQENQDYNIGSSDISMEKRENRVENKMTSNYFKDEKNNFKIDINSWVKATNTSNIWLDIVNRERDSEPEFIKPDRPYFRKPVDHNKVSVPDIKTHATTEDDDKHLIREQHKTSILRDAYGEACLKVVVQKCYKALKKSMKMGCQRHNCKDNFKTSFDQNSRTACIHEFGGKDSKVDIAPTKNPDHDSHHHMQVKDPTQELNVLKNTTKEIIVKGNDTDQIKVIIGRNYERTKPENGFHDITRSGYLAAVCLPEERRSYRRETDGMRSFNILRNKFERECKEISRKKCENACKWAADKTCEVYECVSGLKSSIKDFCNGQCKGYYGYTSSSKSDEDEDEYDDSGSDDSDDSDDSDSDASDSDDSDSRSRGKGKKKNKKHSKSHSKSPSKGPSGNSNLKPSTPFGIMAELTTGHGVHSVHRDDLNKPADSKAGTPPFGIMGELSTVHSSNNGRIQVEALAELDETRTGKIEMEKLKKQQELEISQKYETPEQTTVAVLPEKIVKDEEPELLLEMETMATPEKTEETTKKSKKSKKSKKKSKAKKARRYRRAEDSDSEYGYGIIDYHPFIKNE